MIKEDQIATVEKAVFRLVFERSKCLKRKGVYQEWCNFLRKCLQWVTSEGKQGMTRVKSIKQYVSELALYGSSQVELLEKAWLSLDRSGDPLILTNLCSSIRSTTMSAGDITAVLSVLTVDRLIVSERLINQDRPSLVQGITSPGPSTDKYSALLEEFNDFFTQFIAFHDGKEFTKQLKNVFNPKYGTLLTEKRGPNGRVDESVYSDAVSIQGPIMDNVQWLTEHVAACTAVSYDTKPDHRFLNGVQSYVKEHGSDLKKFSSGKVSLIPCGGGKTRAIALCDLFTQSAMKPIHDKLFDILRSFPQDCTFDQEKGVRTLTEYSSEGSYLASLDLSSATDRFPLAVQKIVMEEVLFSKKAAQVWSDLLVDRDYLVEGKSPVRYSVGQPMGVYSSWAAFTLTHHFIVQFSAYKVRGKLSWFTSYRLLGDDVFIADRKVADKYREIMTTLGVKISLGKSHISGRGTNRPSVGEFAKRIVWKGFDVSPIPLSLIRDAQVRPGSVLSLVMRMRSSSLNVKLKSLRSFIKTHHRKDVEVLDLLLTLPTSVGGAEMREQLSKGAVLSTNTRTGRLALARLAVKISSLKAKALKKKASASVLDGPSLTEDWVPDEMFRNTYRFHPLVRNSSISARETNYGYERSVIDRLSPSSELEWLLRRSYSSVTAWVKAQAEIHSFPTDKQWDRRTREKAELTYMRKAMKLVDNFDWDELNVYPDWDFDVTDLEDAYRALGRG